MFVDTRLFTRSFVAPGRCGDGAVVNSSTVCMVLPALLCQVNYELICYDLFQLKLNIRVYCGPSSAFALVLCVCECVC